MTLVLPVHVIALVSEFPTFQSEIVAKIILKTFCYVTEMRFSKKTIPNAFFHVIL